MYKKRHIAEGARIPFDELKPLSFITLLAMSISPYHLHKPRHGAAWLVDS